MAEENNHQNGNLRTEIALVKKDIDTLTSVTSKLDTAIDKLSEVITSVNRMIAIQEEKLSNTDKSLDDNIEVIHNRIEKTSRQCIFTRHECYRTFSSILEEI